MKRRHRSFRAKKPVRWFVADGTYMAKNNWRDIASSSLVPDVAILALHQRATLATPELVQQNERHTIEAVRGEILMNGSSDANLNLHMGIRVVDLLPTGVPQAYDPQDPDESGDSWMWLKHVYVPLGSLGSVGLSTNNVEVHIKSKRKLLPNQALVLYSTASQTSLDSMVQSNGTVTIYPYLRTLVSRPE